MKIPVWVGGRNSLWVWGLVIVIIVSSVTAAFWDYTQDDVFITYTYSRNLAEGRGFVFNPGEHVQGTTTPLFTVVMAAAYLVTPDLLHAGNVISAVFLLVTTVLALHLTRVSLWGRIAIALLFVTSPLVYVSYGMETLLHSALLMLALVFWARDYRLWAMLAAALLTWNRADGVVLAGTFGLLAAYDWWQIRHAGQKSARYAFPARLFLVYVIGIAPWFIFAWLYFGSPLPQTYSAKEELFEGTVFLKDGAMWWEAFYGNNWMTLVAVPLILIGLWRVWGQRNIRPVAVWTLLYVLGYTVLNVSAFWYYTPVFFTLVLLAVVGGDYLLSELLSERLPAAAPAFLVTGILVVVTAGLGIVKAWEYHAPPPRMATYKLAGEWLNQHTDRNNSLLIKDLGIVGYYAQRYTLDSFGLIVPDMHYTQDTYATLKYKTDWILTTQYWQMQRLELEDWFQYHYVPEAQFSTPGDTEFAPMTAYRRALPLDPPTQIAQGFDLALTCVVSVDAGADLPATTSASLFAETGQRVVQVQHPFLWAQYPSPKATQHEVLIEQIALPLDIDPGHYGWRLVCDTVRTGQVEVLPVERAPGYMPLERQPEWGQFAQLAGFALPEGVETWSGGMVELALHWQAVGASSQDYSVFAHLTDANGMVRAQADGYPRDGDSPSSSWQSGATIVDIRQIRLPPDLPAGDYNLVIGWYDWQSLDRLVASTGQDAVTLPVTIHNQWPGGSGLP